MPFSTYDQDRDTDVLNCGHQYRSGWWFKSYCYAVNLTGKHGSEGVKTRDGKFPLGVHWNDIANGHTANSLSEVTMMVS